MTATEQSAVRIQKCDECGRYQYPSRDLCGNCLSDEIKPTEVDPSGKVRSWTRLHFSLDPAFIDRLPITIAQVQLSCGVRIICFLEANEPSIGQSVSLREQNGPGGGPLFFAEPKNGRMSHASRG